MCTNKVLEQFPIKTQGQGIDILAKKIVKQIGGSKDVTSN
jgi:hypothetical protein